MGPINAVNMVNIIEGVIVTQLKQIAHPKGDVYHAMKCVDSGFIAFGEAYFSTIYGGLIKAWKRHSRMTLNLVCVVGKYILCYMTVEKIRLLTVVLWR